MRRILAVAAIAVLAACERAPAPGAGDGSAVEAVDTAAGAARPRAAWSEDWPETGAIAVRRERAYDLTGDGTEERVVVEAAGPRFDDLDVVLTIRTSRGDTLWHDAWSSARYLEYETAAGGADSIRARIVRAHVDSVLHESRFSARGMPGALRAGEHDALIDRSVQYHLAEIDYRGRASLEARDPTPPEARDRILPESVVPERVRVVREEVEAGPTFTYHAGGEVFYAIGWSIREQSFVRLYSCC